MYSNLYGDHFIGNYYIHLHCRHIVNFRKTIGIICSSGI